MLEYVNHPEETANTRRVHADGLTWIHTGDLGMMDSDGFVYFRQRIKRMIITSGYNVYPSQIENILDAHEYGAHELRHRRKGSLQDAEGKGVRHAEARLLSPSDAIKEGAFSTTAGRRLPRYAMPYDIEFRD